jgi:hypothetical protein
MHWNTEICDLMPFAIARFTKCSIFIFDPRHDSPLLVPGDSHQTVSIAFNGRSDGAAHYDAVKAVETHMPTALPDEMKDEVEPHLPMADEEVKDATESDVPMGDDEKKDETEEPDDEFYSSCVFPHTTCCKQRCYQSTSVEMIM